MDFCSFVHDSLILSFLVCKPKILIIKPLNLAAAPVAAKFFQLTLGQHHNHHLPGIEAAKIMETNGIELGDMQARLLQKIEELTLYLIDQDKKIADLTTELKNIKNNK